MITVAQLLRAGALQVPLFWYYGTILDNNDTASMGLGGRVYFIQYYWFWEWYFSRLSGSEGRNYLDTSGRRSSSSRRLFRSSSSSSRRLFRGSSSSSNERELSCSEFVLWTTNCPLVLACCGLEAVVTFRGHHHSVVTLGFRIQSVFLMLNKIHAWLSTQVPLGVLL